MKVSACLICGSDRFSRLPFGYDHEGQRLQGTLCRACGIIFLDPQLSDEQITALYSKEYFEGDFRCGHTGSLFDDATLADITDMPLVRRIREFQPGGALLDIGCAGGAFLNSARASGFTVRGVEMSPEAAELARTRFGLDVITGDVHAGKFKDGEFDVVYLGDVIEHLPDPRRTFTEINRIMKPGALLVIACPTQTNTLFSRLGFTAYSLLGKNVTVHMPPYHLFEYRPASMHALMTRTGFSIVQLDAGAIPPGEIAMRGSFLQKTGKKVMQYPNAFLTRLTGKWGDRLNVFARKNG
jgi:2-polyprenyl-3-methyl-5-hydroxy-6-metoxy-1,4-benzoquinol methylase